MLIDKCPHCDATHVQTQHMYEDGFDAKGGTSTWRIIRCQNPVCRRLILVTLNSGVIEVMYPASSFDLDSGVSISQEIRDDYKEAGLCLSVSCYKSSMVMSRRVLQRCLKEQGCKQRNLIEAIDYAVKEGILRKPFHKLATEIRQYGNLGAHPDDEQLTDVDAEKAKQILDFARLLIHDFYEVPALADNLRQAREG